MFVCMKCLTTWTRNGCTMLFLLFLLSLLSDADLLAFGPHSRNVSLGEGGIFSCAGYGNILWTVRDTQLNYDLFESWNISYVSNTSDNLRSWSITLPGVEVNNNSDVYCTVLDPQDPVNNLSSEKVYLMIQGMCSTSVI